jgi:hypothetical protein
MRTNKNISKRSKRKTVQRPKREQYQAEELPICLAPPHFTQQENRSIRLRFVCGAAGTFGSVVALNQLAAALGVIATAATTSVFLCDQFRIRRICMWAPVVTAGTTAFCSLKYVDDPTATVTSGPPKSQADTSISFDRPAYVCLTPPKDNSSVFSQWLDSSLTTSWIFLSCSPSTVMDIWFNFVLDDMGVTSAGPTIVGGVAGTIYHKGFTTGAATWALAFQDQNPI